MSGWAIVAIVAIVIWGIVSVVTGRRDHRLDRYSGVTRDEDGNPVVPPPQTTADTGEVRREMESLRERIKVLERIATDSNSLDARETRRISEEIDRLRDRREG